MEYLPVEVIRNILSLIGAAPDVIASATWRKWRQAWKYHLHVITLNSNGWPLYCNLTRSKLEIIVTETISQTYGLLSIPMDDEHEFSAAPVMDWIMYTRNNLCQLHYNVEMTLNINIVEKCSWHKLEVVTLAHNTITGVEPTYQKFPCLRLLALSYVSMEVFDPTLLLSACPKIDALNLVSVDVVMSDPQAAIELISVSVYVCCV